MSYVYEWMEIENIMTHEYSKSYLEKLKDEELDSCDDNDTNLHIPCELRQPECKYYTKPGDTICVSKNRIKHFLNTEKSVEITGRLGGIYKIVDSDFVIIDEPGLQINVFYSLNAR